MNESDMPDDDEREDLFALHYQEQIEQRFWSKVDQSGDCWEWTAYRHQQGYGLFRVGEKIKKAHRVSWEIENGSIPDGQGHHGTCVLHKCDNPPCVNPSHLFLGTQQDNIADMVKKGRVHATGGATGESNGMAKLSDEDVRRIRDMCQCGAVQADVAKIFGVGAMTISRVVRRELWTHI